MNELKNMNRWLKLFACWMAVFFGLFMIQEAAAWLRTGLEAVKNVAVLGGYKVEAKNYSAQLASMTRQHGLLQTFFWTAIVWQFLKKAKGRKFDVRFGYFLVFMLVSIVLLELVQYAAYLVEFVADAVISGVTSREPSLTLKNIISLSRWKDVDWVARTCEGFILSRVFFLIGGILERREYRRALKVARSARAKAENEIMNLEYRIHEFEEKERRRECQRRNNEATATTTSKKKTICLPAGESVTDSKKG